jgi:hypothetical protein
LVLYHIISNLDKITDVIKYSSREVMGINTKMKKDSIRILEDIMKSILLYYSLFYKFDFKKSSELYENRDLCLKEISNAVGKLPASELLVLEKTAAILELVTDISEARMALETH